MYSIDGLNQIERKARKLHLTKACFQKYLNQNPPDKQSKDWIISRKNRFINGNGDYSKYGNALLQYDKIISYFRILKQDLHVIIKRSSFTIRRTVKY